MACLTPLPAGHMIGGTIWKIVKDAEKKKLFMQRLSNHTRGRQVYQDKANGNADSVSLFEEI